MHKLTDIYQQILQEKWVDSSKSPSGEYVELFKNPSKRELKDIWKTWRDIAITGTLRNAGKEDIRGYYNIKNNDLYFWNNPNFVHVGMQGATGIADVFRDYRYVFDERIRYNMRHKTLYTFNILDKNIQKRIKETFSYIENISDWY